MLVQCTTKKTSKTTTTIQQLHIKLIQSNAFEFPLLTYNIKQKQLHTYMTCCRQCNKYVCTYVYAGHFGACPVGKIANCILLWFLRQTTNCIYYQQVSSILGSIVDQTDKCSFNVCVKKRYSHTLLYGVQLANFVVDFTFDIFDKGAVLKVSEQRNDESKTVIMSLSLSLLSTLLIEWTKNHCFLGEQMKI